MKHSFMEITLVTIPSLRFDGISEKKKFSCYKPLPFSDFLISILLIQVILLSLESPLLSDG